MSNSSNKIIISLLVVAIILLLYIAFRPQNLTAPYLQAKPTQDIKKAEIDSMWVSTPSGFGTVIQYPKEWQIMPNYYASAAAQSRGEQYLVGYDFTLPSGAIVSWGGPQSSCKDSEEFEYGVSVSTCLKNLRTSIGHASARKVLSSEDIKLYGDFVLRNR